MPTEDWCLSFATRIGSNIYIFHPDFLSVRSSPFEIQMESYPQTNVEHAYLMADLSPSLVFKRFYECLCVELRPFGSVSLRFGQLDTDVV